MVDRIELQSGRVIEATLCDTANPCVFVAASDLGLTGSESAPAISANTALIDTLSEIQAKIGERIGLWPDWRRIDRPGLPLCVVVAPPADYVDANGATHAAVQHGPAGTPRLPRQVPRKHGGHRLDVHGGRIAHPRLSGASRRWAEGAASSSLRIGHPLGVMQVRVECEPHPAEASPLDVRYAVLGFARTARRLMAGELYIPVDAGTEPR